MEHGLVAAAHVGGTIGAAVLAGTQFPPHVDSIYRLLTTILPTGYIGCFSFAGVATLNEAPLDTRVKQFRRMYNIGKASSPYLAVAATLCNGFSAYRARADARITASGVPYSALYLAAAMSVLAIVPFTLLYMEPIVNRRLLDLGGQAETGVKTEQLGVSEEAVGEMMELWKRSNFVRAALVGMGALAAAVASVA